MPPTTSFFEQLFSGTLFTCPTYAKTRYQTMRDMPCPLGLLQLFNLVNPKLAYSPSPILSHGIYNKSSCPHFLLPPGTLSQPYCFPVLPCMACCWELWVKLLPLWLCLSCCISLKQVLGALITVQQCRPGLPGVPHLTFPGTLWI